MKKIYISVDTEGLNGVTSFQQVLPENNLAYSQMLTQLHLELNSLIEGLQVAGIEEIFVNDAHNTMTNISLTKLPDNVRLISGKPKPVSMMYGLDETFDGVIFMAYHSKATSNGVLAHTFNMDFKSVSINNKLISEAELNGIYASLLGVPIVLVSGDDIFCNEIKNDLLEIETIITKKAISSSSAICRKNKDLLEEYSRKAKKINDLKGCYYNLENEYNLVVELEYNKIADFISEKTGIISQNSSLIFNSKNYVDIYLALQKISSTLISYKNQNQLV